jgi:SsrA-binding protein
MASRKKADERFRDVAQNRKALHEYEIIERVEAGLVLLGSEVKGLRERGASIRDAYAQIRDGEVFLVGLHIPEYFNARFGHEPLRTRKLLLNRREIDRIAGQLNEKGLSLIPLRIYFAGSHAKVELGIGRGKKLYDKRRAIAERDARRDADRAVKARNR